MPPPDPRCGTYAGYLAHRKRQEPSCEPCNVARRNYQNQYRAANAELRAMEARRALARQRAYRRLSRMFPAQFLELYEEEKAK